MIKISTSILASNNRTDCIKKLNNTETNYIHIDVMDNKFVPNYQLPIDEVNELAKISKKPFDIHLMVEKPETYIKSLKTQNIHNISIHLELNKDIDYLIDLIKSYNYKVGIAIKPNTNIDLIDKYINKIDYVLIMSVEPGFGGQTFINNSVDRIKTIRNKKADILIEVDGGINDTTIDKVKYIVDTIVVGSYITKSNNYNKAINNLKN